MSDPTLINAWWIWLLLPVVGALGGFLAGLLGVGGGIIFIPLLTWLFHHNGLSSEEVVRFTLANSLLLVFASGLSGSFKQWKNKTLMLKTALYVGIPGAVVSYLVSWSIKAYSWYHKEEFQMVFLAFLLIAILNMLFFKGKDESVNVQEQKNSNREIGIGAASGLVVSLTGLGGGVVMVPMFRMLMKLPMRKSTGLSLSIIPILTTLPLLGYVTGNAPSIASAHTGYLAWGYSIPMMAGVVIFSPLGVKTAQKVPQEWLRGIFALLSTSIFIKTIFEIWGS